MAHLRDITQPLQLVYGENRSVDDAVNMGLHYVLLVTPGSFARILFVEHSSAFNTIIPQSLRSKQLTVPALICQWITNFLTDQRKLHRIISTGTV